MVIVVIVSGAWLTVWSSYFFPNLLCINCSLFLLSARDAAIALSTADMGFPAAADLEE